MNLLFVNSSARSTQRATPLPRPSPDHPTGRRLPPAADGDNETADVFACSICLNLQHSSLHLPSQRSVVLEKCHYTIPFYKTVSCSAWPSVPRYRRLLGGCLAGKAKKHVTMEARPSVRMIGQGLATLDLRGSDQGACLKIEFQLHNDMLQDHETLETYHVCQRQQLAHVKLPVWPTGTSRKM